MPAGVWLSLQRLHDPGAEQPRRDSGLLQHQLRLHFPLFEKVTINSELRHPFYAQLIAAQPAAIFPATSDFHAKLAEYKCLPKLDRDILWNFEKFLIGRDGQIISRFSPDTTPDDTVLVAAIEAAPA